MKPIYLHLGGALALSFTIAACVPAPDSTPAPTPTPTPTPSPTATAPAPQRPAPPASENWIDRPQTAGDWSYRAGADGGVAMFGENADKPLFAIDCDRGAAGA